eukprot:scaffold196_cov371-Prasinococcus_capsulatus_cf.AAC.3
MPGRGQSGWHDLRGRQRRTVHAPDGLVQRLGRQGLARQHVPIEQLVVPDVDDHHLHSNTRIWATGHGARNPARCPHSPPRTALPSLSQCGCKSTFRWARSLATMPSCHVVRDAGAFSGAGTRADKLARGRDPSPPRWCARTEGGAVMNCCRQRSIFRIFSTVSGTSLRRSLRYHRTSASVPNFAAASVSGSACSTWRTAAESTSASWSGAAHRTGTAWGLRPACPGLGRLERTLRGGPGRRRRAGQRAGGRGEHGGDAHGCTPRPGRAWAQRRIIIIVRLGGTDWQPPRSLRPRGRARSGRARACLPCCRTNARAGSSPRRYALWPARRRTARAYLAS